MRVLRFATGNDRPVANGPAAGAYHQLAHAVGHRDRGEDGQRDAARNERLKTFAHLVGRPEDECVLDHLPGGGGEGRVAVLGVPRGDHVVDAIAVAEPAEERLVDRDRGIRREHEACQPLHLAPVTGDAEEAAQELEALRRPLELLRDARQPGQREEVREGPCGSLDREAEHLAPERREDDRGRLGGRLLQLEARRRPFAGEGRIQELDRLGNPREGSVEGHAVPALDDAIG